MTFGAAADHGFAHLVHLDRGLNPSFDPGLLKRVLHRERVHDRCKHAHIVGLGTIHALGGTGHATEDVTATDHQA